MYIEEKFLRAASLLVPHLDPDDIRVKQLASYAKKAYETPMISAVDNGKKVMREGCLCVLLAIPGSRVKTYRDFANFCMQIGIMPGRREVIIHKEKIFFTDDYRYEPIPV